MSDDTDFNEFTPEHRQRFHILVAHPDVMPNFDEYAEATTREIPVVVPDPV